MIERMALRDAVTHMLCCSWAICFSAAASSVKAQGSMNLASKTAPVCSTFPVPRRRHPFMDRMANTLLDVLNRVPARALIPGAIQNLGYGAELDDQIV